VSIDIPSDKDFEVEIMNATGERMIREQNQKVIDISNLATGVYMVKIFNADFVVTQKLVKQ
jgi:hypothetical protein